MTIFRAFAVVLLASLMAVACDGDGPSQPSSTNLTGTWSGTGTYPNAPFQLALTQTNGTLRGEYRDRLDRSLAVTGTFSSPTMAVVVDFGDAKLNLDGAVVDSRRIEGTMFTSALGNTRYPFVLTR